MLLEFSVSNFRSIRDEQTLSLVASKALKEHKESVINDHELPGVSQEHFLPGAAIYGPNASGKSTLLHSLKYLQDFLSETGLRPAGEAIPIPHFALDADSADAPTVFRLHFVAGDGVRYEYGIALTRTRVLEEGLTAYPRGKPQVIFHREYKDETSKENESVYAWNLAGIAKGKAVLGILKTLCPENAALLARITFFEVPELLPALEWFKHRLRIFDLSASGRLDDKLSAKMLHEGGRLAEGLKEALRTADFGIADTRVALDPLTNLPVVTFLHEAGDLGARALPMDDESSGTRRYFAMMGPLLEALTAGHTVLIDEIDTSLHALMVRELVKLFHSRATNPRRAQLIFTTHNPILLDTDLLRRDQYWFTDKARDGATHLYPLVTYAPRKDESLLRGYVGGRYGALPFMPDGLSPIMKPLLDALMGDLHAADALSAKGPRA